MDYPTLIPSSPKPTGAENDSSTSATTSLASTLSASTTRAATAIASRLARPDSDGTVADPMSATFRSMQISRPSTNVILSAPSSSSSSVTTAKKTPTSGMPWDDKKTSSSSSAAPDIFFPLHHQRSHENGTSSSSSSTITKTILTSATLGPIPPLPPLYLLDRTSLEIDQTKVSATEVMERLLDFFRRASIAIAKDDSDSGKVCCLECTSPTGLQCHVQLWRSTKTNNIVVEVQRQSGCSLELNTLRRQLLRYVATGASTDASTPQQQHSILEKRRPVDLQDRRFKRRRYDADVELPSLPNRRRASSSSPSPEGAASSSNCCLHLLDSSQLYQQQLGLESLAVVVNPHCSGHRQATEVGRSLLLDSSGPLATRVVAIWKRQVQSVADASSSSSYGIVLQQQRMGWMLLQILAHALEQVVGGGGGEVDQPLDLALPLWQTAVPLLWQYVQADAVAAHPHEAAAATKCLYYLQIWQKQQLSQEEVSPRQTSFHTTTTARAVAAPGISKQTVTSVASSALPSFAQESLENALVYGQSHHQALEEETTRLLQLFGS